MLSGQEFIDSGMWPLIVSPTNIVLFRPSRTSAGTMRQRVDEGPVVVILLVQVVGAGSVHCICQESQRDCAQLPITRA